MDPKFDFSILDDAFGLNPGAPPTKVECVAPGCSAEKPDPLCDLCKGDGYITIEARHAYLEAQKETP